MTTKVAVYGTLKKKYHNHPLLGDSKFIAYTSYPGLLLHMGGFPGAILAEDVHPDHVCHKFVNNYMIACEIYEVNQPVLARLDRLEGHPDFYYRTPVLDPQHGEVHIYTQRAAKQLHGVKKCVPGGFWYGENTSVMDVNFFDGTQKPKILCWRGGNKPSIIIPDFIKGREEEPRGVIVPEKPGIPLHHGVHPFHDDEDWEDGVFDEIPFHSSLHPRADATETEIDLSILDQVKEA